jgi:hypothetical protein
MGLEIFLFGHCIFVLLVGLQQNNIGEFVSLVSLMKVPYWCYPHNGCLDRTSIVQVLLWYFLFTFGLFDSGLGGL